MKRSVWLSLAVILPAGLWWGLRAGPDLAVPPPAEKPAPVSVRPLHGPAALCTVGDNRLAVCFAKSREVALFDLQDSPAPLRSARVEGEPSGMVWDAERNRLLVTTGPGPGFLHALDDESLDVLSSRPMGHGPVSPVLDPAGGRLFIAKRFDQEVEILEADSLESCASVSVGREPVALAYSPIHGGRVVVAHLLSDRPATADWTGCSISVLDPSAAVVEASIPLADGSSGARGIAITADGRYALSPMVIGSHRVPATTMERGWINKQGLAIVDLESANYLGSVLLDDLSRGAANPWGIVTTPDDEVWISLAGVHEVMCIDWRQLRELVIKLDDDQREALAETIGFARDTRKRHRLGGHVGPRAMAWSEGRLFVAGYFSNSIAWLPTAGTPRDVLPARQHAEDLGELLFHDATLCFQQWMSCSSCHPDGRTDALNWDLANDGPGTPRQAKSMVFSYHTPPTTITGCRADAVVSTRAGLRFLRAVRSEEEAAAIDRFLSSLRPLPSPHLVEGEQLSASALRGKQVFDHVAHCGRCHSGDHFTNGGQFRVGTEQAGETGLAFDVPTLREVWRTAPYFNDGRSPTIRDLLTNHHEEMLHGSVEHLDDQQLEDLIEYVLSL